jgi:hypothetical protein
VPGSDDEDELVANFDLPDEFLTPTSNETLVVHDQALADWMDSVVVTAETPSGFVAEADGEFARYSGGEWVTE